MLLPACLPGKWIANKKKTGILLPALPIRLPGTSGWEGVLHARHFIYRDNTENLKKKNKIHSIFVISIFSNIETEYTPPFSASRILVISKSPMIHLIL